MDELMDTVSKFEKKRRSKGMSIYSFSKNNTVLRAVGKAFTAIIGLPYYIISAIASLPMWLTYYILKGSTKDRAFHNTVGLGVRLGLGLVLAPIYLILAFCLLPWPFAVAFLLLTIPSLSYFFDYNEAVRRFVSDIKVLSDKNMRSFFKNIVKKFSKV
jgi:hypothetical protein